MKAKIHPEYNPKVKAKCSCGIEFIVGSTMDNIEIEICSQCHPFYTGSEKVVDKAGRVEKFKRRQEAAAKAKTQKHKSMKAQKTQTKETAKGKVATKA